jgi:hypothetical protein
MARPGLAWLTVLLVGACAGGVFLLTRDSGSPPPSKSSLERTDTAEAGPASKPLLDSKKIVPGSSPPSAESDSRPRAAISRKQWDLIADATGLVEKDKLTDLSQKALSEEEIEALKKEIREFARRDSELRSEYMQKGSARAKEVYDAGGWQAWPERVITIPYPGKPGQTITRNASPYDDKVEDEFISETGANGPDGKLQNRVVRLRPDTDSVWGAVVADHRTRRAALREEARAAVDRALGR